MGVIYLPKNLKLLIGILFLMIPFAIVQVPLVDGSEMWDLPKEKIFWVSILFVCLYVFFSFLISLGKKFSLDLLTVFGMSWSLTTIFLAFEKSSYWLGIFSILLSCFWILIFLMLHRVFSKPYFDFGARWYEGEVGVNSDLKVQIGEIDYGVSKISFDGLYLWGKCSARLQKSVSLKMYFRDSFLFETEARVVQQNRNFFGVGLEFAPTQKNELKFNYYLKEIERFGWFT